MSPGEGECAWVLVEDVSAVAAVRRRVTELAERLAFGSGRVAELALAASEAASNLHKHAKAGVCVVQVARVGGAARLDLVAIDSGPGISDVSRSLRDGYSTAGTLGLGMGTIARLADSSDMFSLPGSGSVLAATFLAMREGSTPLEQPFAGLVKPINGESVCGDAYAVKLNGDTTVVMLCDGLGHGPLAGAAAQEAVRAVSEAGDAAGPAELLRRIHARISHTRGGAVSVAEVDHAAGRVRFAGLGNVSGWVVGPEGRRGMISLPGIAGHQGRQVREHVYDLPPGGSVILHSDGLSDRWDLTNYPGLFARSPLVIAGTLLRDAGVRNDDRSIVVVKDTRHE